MRIAAFTIFTINMLSSLDPPIKVIKCLFKQIDITFSCVRPVITIMNFVIALSKELHVDPRVDSRVDPQTTLTIN